MVSWDGDLDLLPQIRARCEQDAESLNLVLTPTSSPRLLALWDRPQVAWQIDNALDNQAWSLVCDPTAVAARGDGVLA